MRRDSGVALVLGPLWFLMEDTGGARIGGMSAGRTFWFWLALIAGLASAGGAAWKKFGAPAKA